MKMHHIIGVKQNMQHTKESCRNGIQILCRNRRHCQNPNTFKHTLIRQAVTPTSIDRDTMPFTAQTHSQLLDVLLNTPVFCRYSFLPDKKAIRIRVSYELQIKPVQIYKFLFLSFSRRRESRIFYLVSYL